MIPRTRRQFVQDLTMGTAAALLASRVQPLAAQTASASQWRSRIGLELYTVRDLLEADYEGTLAKVADDGLHRSRADELQQHVARRIFGRCSIGYKLTMPSTHAPARGTGADLERQLEGFQVMGIKYTEIARRPARGRTPRLRILAGLRPFHRARTSTPARDASATRSKKPKPSDRIRPAGVARIGQAAGRHNSTRTARSRRSSA